MQGKADPSTYEARIGIPPFPNERQDRAMEADESELKRSG